MKIDMDFRLLDVSLELHALEEYLETIEKQIDHIKESEKLIIDAAIRREGITPDDPEWHFEHQTYDHRMEFLLPRFFRGPFIVSLYAVYEAAVTEIARLIQKAQGQAISIDDLRGEDFLDRAKKYYKHILHFELCSDNSIWQQIMMLSEIRNAIAHTNGRLEMLRKRAKERIWDWEQRKIGIELQGGYIIVDAAFLQRTFSHVRISLEDLVNRYKRWDSSQKTA
ncbi:MAG: hypothetical protein SRB2_03871 [Desulfobacteraceae bacterium Eth-SRB2]|nr:MAG: hypothetical protein SRB2_03871 [Desulfobacteraceae bacterium Eth-SRB2]